MSNHKFLSDGRKVAVIGQLNNQESIVQEIFVTESGDEVPSGERFVVMSLHDEPVISYNEKRKIEVEKALQKAKQEEEKAQKDKRAAWAELEAVREMLRSSKKLIELLPEAEIDNFVGFMTGTIKYLVIDSWRIQSPVKMIDEIIDFECKWGEKKFDSIKLLSVMGKSGGDLSYRINRYSDGSGGSGTEVFPFANLEDAIAHIKNTAVERIENNRLEEVEMEVCESLGIEFSKGHIKKYKSYRLKQLKEALAKKEEDHSKHIEAVSDITSRLKELEKL